MDRIIAESEQRLKDLKTNSLQGKLLHDDPQLQAVSKAVSNLKSGDKNLDQHLAAVFSFLIDHYPDQAL